MVLSADYQQSKLIPHWGHTAQPGQTYYYQKVSHDVFGVIDHREGKSTVYIFSEEIGPKNTDHTISLLSQYLTGVQLAFPWIRRICLFLDNVGSTNKNKFFFSWCMELVESKLFDHVHVAFLIAGHTKFAPDRTFAAIAQTYNTSDVFCINELCDVCSVHTTAIVIDGSEIYH